MTKAGPNRWWLAVLVAAALAGRCESKAAAAGAFLVTDIETEVDPRGSSSPLLQARLGDFVYFSAVDALHGEELWRTDGTSAGTSMVADLCPGPCSSRPLHATALGGRLLFSAEGELGREPWVSDGSAAGTRPLGDLCPGPCSSIDLSDSMLAAALPEATLFVAFDPGAGRELWRTDGTPEGTARLVDLSPGPSDSDPSTLISFAGLVYFAATEPAHGRELWASDGTAAGTRLVEDFSNGPKSSRVEVLGALGDRLLVRETPISGSDLWMVQPNGRLLYLGNAPCHADCSGLAVAAAGDWMLISKTSSRQGVSGSLWRTDLTPQGTEQLADFPATDLTRVGNRVFFRARGSELWVSDGTVAGTRLVRDFGPDAPGRPSHLHAFGDLLVFVATSATHGAEPWISDGTEAGTRVIDAVAGPIGSLTHVPYGLPGVFAVLEDRLLFSAYTAETGRELWVTAGTPATTHELADLYRDSGSRPAGLAAWKGRLHFSASRSGHGFDPWVSDGTATGTAFLGDLPAQAYPSRERVAFGDHLYFAANDPPVSWQLWRTDGTAAGTAAIPGSDGFAHGFTPLGPRLLLFANPEDSCYDGNCSELMSLEPGAPEVSLVAEINRYTYYDSVPYWPVLPASAEASRLVPLGTGALFTADDGDHGREPWISDGSPGGTRLLVDLCPGPCSQDPRELGRLGETVLFLTGLPTNAGQLWRSDGTAAGTIALRTFASGQDLRELVVTGTRGYFIIAGAAGAELWASDGTASGTLRVSDLSLDGTPARARRLTAVGTRLYLAVYHGTTGEELWTSDGTAGGTRMVADIASGPASASPAELAAIDGRLVFAATDGASGVEPWISDGSAEGTRRLDDIAAGPAASSPAEFTRAGELLFFSAADAERGRELWAAPLYALAAHGLLATYFGDPLLGGARLRRVDPWLDFNWGLGAPASTLPADDFSVRWTGEIEAPATGSFTFFLRSDDGARLWIDDVLLIDDWGPHVSRVRSGTRALVAGKRHRVKLEYRELAGPSGVRLLWSRPGVPRQVVPAKYLFPGE